MSTASESARANAREVNFASLELEVLLRRGLMRGIDLFDYGDDGQSGPACG